MNVNMQGLDRVQGTVTPEKILYITWGHKTESSNASENVQSKVRSALLCQNMRLDVVYIRLVAMFRG